MAAVLFVARRDGKKALAMGVAAVLVLLALTLVFPPYWLRGVLIIALLGGLVWIGARRPRHNLQSPPSSLRDRAELGADVGG
jgi:membrane protein implicated in regulation of membrane protease activity